MDKKALTPPLAMFRPMRVGQAASWTVSVLWIGERSSIYGIPGGGRHPGFRERSALRGAGQERGPRSTREDGGSIQPFVQRVDDRFRGARVAIQRRGTSHPRRTARSRRCEGWSFARGGPARAVQRCRPTIAAASGGWVEASPASGVAVGRWLSGSCFPACLQRRAAGIERTVTARGTRGPSSRGEGRRSVNGEAGASARPRLLPEAGPRICTRIGSSGVCPCVGVKLQKSLGGSLIQRSACRRDA